MTIDRQTSMLTLPLHQSHRHHVAIQSNATRALADAGIHASSRESFESREAQMDGFEWGVQIDKASIVNPKSGERRLIQKLRVELPMMSDESWQEVFEIMRTERRRRLGIEEK